MGNDRIHFGQRPRQTPKLSYQEIGRVESERRGAASHKSPAVPRSRNCEGKNGAIQQCQNEVKTKGEQWWEERDSPHDHTRFKSHERQAAGQ